MNDTSGIKVKFRWNLRQRPADQVPEKPKCRTTAYMHNLKASKPEKYQELKEKDANRKQKNYIPITNLSEAEKKKQRDKWAENKRKQRKAEGTT